MFKLIRLIVRIKSSIHISMLQWIILVKHYHYGSNLHRVIAVSSLGSSPGHGRDWPSPGPDWPFVSSAALWSVRIQNLLPIPSRWASTRSLGCERSVRTRNCELCHFTTFYTKVAYHNCRTQLFGPSESACAKPLVASDPRRPKMTAASPRLRIASLFHLTQFKSLSQKLMDITTGQY